MRHVLEGTVVALAGAIIFAGGWVVGTVQQDEVQPMRTNDPVECPSEDSCRPIYVDGAWVIVEDPG